MGGGPAEYARILAGAECVPGVHRGCMLKRNRRLVDMSRGCIAYQTKATGGTAYRWITPEDGGFPGPKHIGTRR